MHSVSAWKFAKTPNYNTNVDKLYPYSEVPYIGEYNLVKIPQSLHNLIDLVDYWGEGKKRVTEHGISGFPNCYNVNHQYQLVSNGPDTDAKIPNRIPVISYTDCDTSSYIKDNSVKIVTLMGAPIHKSCSKDIARMVNTDQGKVVVFGFDSNTADIRNLDEALKEKGIIHCDGYQLPEVLKGITLFDSHRAYLNLTEIGDELYKNITFGIYNNAINISQQLENTGNGDVIVDVVTKLIKNKIKNIVTFAYKLWTSSAKEIVSNYFPLQFKLIVGEEKVKIISRNHLMALKLDASTDYYGDRLAWGDSKDKSSDRVSWKIIPNWENNDLSFRIKNLEHEMFLKLDVTTDSYGDRQCWGSTNNTNDGRYLWSLEVVKIDDDILFYIINRDYNQGLKLDATPDSYGDRLLWGNNGSVYGNPNYYGWYIAPWI